MEIERVFKNTAFLFVGRGFEKAAQFLVLILVARHALLGSYGQYALALYFTGMCTVLFDLGLQPFTVREVARDPGQFGKLFVNGLAVKVIYTFAFFSLLWMVVMLLRYPKGVAVAIMVALAGRVFWSFGQFNKGFLRAYGKMEYEALTALFEALTLLAITGWALRTGASVKVLCASWVASGFCGLVLSLFFLNRKIFLLRHLSWQPQRPLMREIARESVFFGLCSIATLVYFYLDSVMLSKMDVMESVAVYTAAYNLVFALMFIPQIYVDVLYPLLSNYHSGQGILLKEIVADVSKYLVLLTVPIGLGATLLAKPIIVFFYGAKMLSMIHGKGASDALQILIWDGCIIFFTYFWGNALAAMQRQRVVTVVGGVGAGLNIALNFLLIPRYSFIGAATATVVTEAVIFCCLIYLLASQLQLQSLFGAFLRAGCGGFIMFVALFYLVPSLSLPFAVVAGAGFYGVGLLLTGGIGIRDFTILKGLLARW